MSGHDEAVTAPDDGADDTAPDEAREAELDAFDLDGDGKISIVELERARLGIVDARLEELSEEGGVGGALAKGAHKVLDQLDND